MYNPLDMARMNSKEEELDLKEDLSKNLNFVYQQGKDYLKGKMEFFSRYTRPNPPKTKSSEINLNLSQFDIKRK